MPYKTGKLKGELTLPELRKLVKAHNKLQSIQVPAGINRDGMIKLIEKNGFDINHKQEKIIPKTRPRRQDVSLARAKKILEKPKLTAIQQQKADEKKSQALANKKKKEREKKKQIIEEQKNIQKMKDEKKKVAKPPPKPQATRNNPKSNKIIMMSKDDTDKKNKEPKKIKSIKKTDDIKKFIEDFTKSKMTDTQYNRIKKWLGRIFDELGVITIREMKTEWIIDSRTNKTPYIRGENIHIKKIIGRGNKKDDKEKRDFTTEEKAFLKSINELGDKFLEKKEKFSSSKTKALREKGIKLILDKTIKVGERIKLVDELVRLWDFSNATAYFTTFMLEGLNNRNKKLETFFTKTAENGNKGDPQQLTAFDNSRR